MIASFFVSFLLSQATPTPALSPDWKSVPVQGAELVRYVRQEKSGDESTLLTFKETCACKPADFTARMQYAVSSIQNVTAKQEVVKVCGTDAQHLVLTGIAKAGSGKNLDVYAFRTGGDIYALMYTFKSDAPVPEAEAALLALCPAPTPSST